MVLKLLSFSRFEHKPHRVIVGWIVLDTFRGYRYTPSCHHGLDTEGCVYFRHIPTYKVAEVGTFCVFFFSFFFQFNFFFLSKGSFLSFSPVRNITKYGEGRESKNKNIHNSLFENSRQVTYLLLLINIFNSCRTCISCRQLYILQRIPIMNLSLSSWPVFNSYYSTCIITYSSV